MPCRVLCRDRMRGFLSEIFEVTCACTCTHAPSRLRHVIPCRDGAEVRHRSQAQSRLQDQDQDHPMILWPEVQGLGSRVSGLGPRAKGPGSRVWGPGFWIYCLWSGVWGLWSWV
eukprot:2980313-Rhodomonas_salina.2